MDDKWKGTGYDPQKAWDGIKREQWEKDHPGKLGLREYALIAGVVIAGGLTLLFVGIFIWQRFG